MAAATTIQVRKSLAAQLKLSDQSELGQHWDDTIDRALLFAVQEVYGRLLARGFRLDEEIRAWDRLGEFTLDLAVWKSIMLGGIYAGFDPAALAALDRRAELASVYVFVNGDLVEIRPAMGKPGTAMTGGPMARDASGVFDWQPGEPGYGIEW
ncbi:MAG TPA: hypothetical protein VF526_15425 [Solirubrobacteraceae bacterium]|jgi:hypothetical protein